jgi:NTP pyrophosphatase (non-canonical NTP hydrolase)
MDLGRLQREVGAWADRNFGPTTGSAEQVAFNALGVVEEVGELAHALLKQHQGIRGSWEEHETAGQDAVADVVIFLANLCHRKGWDLDAVIEETWERVSRRDWQADAREGRAA